MTIAVAAAQTFVSSDISENGRVIREKLREAAARGARLVLFCEGALSGYSKAQIRSPRDWRDYDWELLNQEIEAIATQCSEVGIFAAIGSAYPVSSSKHPTNSLIVVSDTGKVAGRYNKRFLSNSEVNDWYTPGTEPLLLEIDGFRFGFAICIEAAFPEVFAEYERRDVDAVLYASYGIKKQFKTALQAHAYLNCYWIVAATPAQEAPAGPAFICGPEGDEIVRAAGHNNAALVHASLNRQHPTYDVALNKARPWRRKARHGDIYQEKLRTDSDY